MNRQYANGKEKNYVLMMGLYGNRTIIDMTREKLENKSDGINLEHMILGILDKVAIAGDEKFDTTILSIPNTNNLVILYNKYQEEKVKTHNEQTKPLISIPTENIEIYSRCVICRQDNDGKLNSIEPQDMNSILNYLAD
jgi:hypothetical protein